MAAGAALLRVSVEDLWRLYTCRDPMFLALVSETVQRVGEEMREARGG